MSSRVQQHTVKDTEDLLRYTRQAGRGMHASITILRYQQESVVSIALKSNLWKVGKFVGMLPCATAHIQAHTDMISDEKEENKMNEITRG